ncbi:hypothetical protein [Confluentibacter sediminis]|uniref:hypothetical protein n=1 Tax=Confluentibacter sediminis TaxID=2219045 RepID=UPI000DABA153|nr:hypothetical protein [Confluentibacter sediminis]
MKSLKNTLAFVALCFSITLMAQESEVSSETSLDKTSYYRTRAMEDAKFEQEFEAQTADEEKAFWDEKKTYEDELKKKDKEAYQAYVQGKKDAYKEHYDYCDDHCHHGEHYYTYATVYYRPYRHRYVVYRQYPAVRTHVRVVTPRVRVGLF